MTQVTPKQAASAGGLAVGLHAALKDAGGVWFGWSGEITEKSAERPKRKAAGKITYALVDLSQGDYDDYYGGFANRTLWPLFHYRIDLTRFEHAWYETYRDVNRRFARLLAPMIEPGDTIWVHDYHLIPLGRELRALGVEAKIGFFLHIPFPPGELFVTMPWHHAIGEDLFAYDLIGFQTETDLRQFEDYVSYEWRGDVGRDDVCRVAGRTFRAGAFPIGIDVEHFVAMAQSQGAQNSAGRVKRTLAGRRLLVGVDRLDYSKGILERLRAYQQMLDDRPEHRRGVTFMQISAPSREDVQEYQVLRAQVEALTGHINGLHSEADWVPVRYINRSHTQRDLAGFYRLGRIGLVTPLRDGMNLVAQEYIAAQDPDDPGVLVLSRFAGARPLLEDGAIVVNPYDTYATALALHQGLGLPLDERKARHARMLKAIRAHDINAWRTNFLAALDKV